MRKVLMIRTEPGLLSIPLEQAIYCESCGQVSNSAWNRCGLCGSENIVSLAPLFSHPPDPNLPPSSALAQIAA